MRFLPTQEGPREESSHARVGRCWRYPTPRTVHGKCLSARVRKVVCVSDSGAIREGTVVRAFWLPSVLRGFFLLNPNCRERKTGAVRTQGQPGGLRHMCPTQIERLKGDGRAVGHARK